MKLKKSSGMILILLASLAGLIAYAAAPDITGTWIGKTDVPGAGADDLTLIVKKTSTGFAGTFNDTLGQVNKDAEISSVKLEGADLSFNFPLVDGTMMIAKLKIDGDTMTGTWGHPEGGMGDMTFKRKK
jgi:hypothetical protein